MYNMKIAVLVTITFVFIRMLLAGAINRYPGYGQRQGFKVDSGARQQEYPAAGPPGFASAMQRKQDLDIQMKLAKAEAEAKETVDDLAMVNQYNATWPYGRYALPKTTSGCPYGWSNGSRFQDNENTINQNSASDGIQTRMDVVVDRDLLMNYCVKEYSSGYNSSGPWPPGRYCIARKGGYCPSGFSSGTVYWDDENRYNSNNYTGILPDGIYNSDTTVYYCCRSDGYYRTPISLPTSMPFYLYRYGLNCQRVQGMSVVEDSISTDDEDTWNENSCTGSNPARFCGSNIDLEFCYYRSIY